MPRYWCKRNSGSTIRNRRKSSTRAFKYSKLQTTCSYSAPSEQDTPVTSSVTCALPLFEGAVHLYHTSFSNVIAATYCGSGSVHIAVAPIFVPALGLHNGFKSIALEQSSLAGIGNGVLPRYSLIRTWCGLCIICYCFGYLY